MQAIREVDFLEGIAESHLTQIAGVARLADFPRGKLIFREGETATDIFLIVAGNVALEICAPGIGCRRILTVGPGELLGWSPVLEHARMTASARTLEPTVALAINGRQMLALCEQNPQFGYEFMRRSAQALARRLTATRMQLLDVFGTQMPSVPGTPRDQRR